MKYQAVDQEVVAYCINRGHQDAVEARILRDDEPFSLRISTTRANDGVR